MLFNSIDFAIFMPLVFVLYWFVFNKSLFKQNLFLLFASYFFYGYWDWRFLFLIMISTIADYILALKIKNSEDNRKRKLYLWLSIIINIGILGFFKYFNFFLDNINHAFSFFGHNLDIRGLDIVLPVGISFYTFQTMSYTIDVYRGKLKPTKDFIAFAAYVAFFPQLVAGPIERAKNLLPQMLRKREFDYEKATDGMRQILWGLFKKMIIADNAAKIVDEVFANYHTYPASSLVIAAVLFAFQIYGDFSGYSDIAIGTARLLGFDLMQNFAYPYFSRDVAEFWRRWHISLSTWFRDYVYIPLGGSRVGMAKKIRNVFIIFLLSGFWHGANWTFLAWGGINAMMIMPLMLLNKNRLNKDIVAKEGILPSLKEFFGIISTFVLITIAWIFFRSVSITGAFEYINGILDKSIISMPYFGDMSAALKIIVFIFIFILIEWWGREEQFAIANIKNIRILPLRWLIYLIIVISIVLYKGESQQFIYFQF